MMSLTRRCFLAGAAAIGGAGPAVARAGTAIGLEFELHARFFSVETHQPVALDPQVFVADPASATGPGPQGIVHAAGFRPALFSDPPATPLYNARGAALGFDLGQWFAARGAARLVPEAAGTLIHCSFSQLRPGGVYSLFETHFDQTPIGFTPLDGSGTRNGFRAGAGGGGQIRLAAPGVLSHANALLLVYHSDRLSHGMSRGVPGVTAHHQLIARVPVPGATG